MDNEAMDRRPFEGLLEWLVGHDVEYEVHEHPLAFSAAGTARAEGVDARTFAKVLGVETDDGRRALLVLDAVDRLDIAKATRELEARQVRLLTEAELAAVTPGCVPGAVPAVGELFGLPMRADTAVRDDPAISFNAGTHRHTVRVDRPAWERATGVRYADLAMDDPDRPAWAS
jgi:Ala-tRNA(Pro) deacylase